MEGVEGKGREKMYDGILAQIQGLEEKVGRKTMGWGVEDVKGLKIPITANDVGYLVEEVYRGRSVVSGVPTRLALVRWKKAEGQSVDVREGQKSSKVRLGQLVCMTKEEAKVHEREVVLGDKQVEELYSPEVIELVEQRMREEEEYAQWR